MKLEEIFEFKASEYQSRVSQQETPHLRKKEIVKTRQLKKSKAETYLGAVEAVGIGGAAVLKPIYAHRQYEVAETKLKIIQEELTNRGISLHTPDEADKKAAILGVVVGELASQAIAADLPIEIPPPSLDCVMPQMLAGELFSDGIAEATDKLPGKTCSRLNLETYHRLRCDMCGTYFDTSFTEYLRSALSLLDCFCKTYG